MKPEHVTNLVEQGKCEGACEQHLGVVQPWHVRGWGWFSYCDAAVQEDRSRGLALSQEAPNET